jgi:hypothetical protein
MEAQPNGPGVLHKMGESWFMTRQSWGGYCKTVPWDDRYLTWENAPEDSHRQSAASLDVNFVADLRQDIL